MAQTAKAPRKKASSSNATTKRKAASNGTAKRKPAATKSKSSTSARSKPRANAQPTNGSGSIPAVAVEKTKHAAHAVADAASKAKTPLIAGGTALVGAAAGVVAKERLGAKRSKNPLNKLRGAELDLDKVKSTAERVSAYGQQASDIASAVQKARKKNKA
jgi:hypothetical protein